MDHTLKPTLETDNIIATPRARVLGPLVAALVAISGCTAPAEEAEQEATSQSSALKLPFSVTIAERTLRITGTSQDSKLTLRLRYGSPNTLEVDIGDDGTADATAERDQFDRIIVEGGSGDDVLRIDETSGAFTHLQPTTLDGGKGNDTLIGGVGAETLIGGPGKDTIIGRYGNDVVLMGDGDDTFIWNPGDGSDVIEGEGGKDKIEFNGANIGERITFAANGSRLQFSRDIANITLDVNGVERMDYRAMGGADTIVVHDLTGTGVTEVNVDLASAVGGGPDAQGDAVRLEGSTGTDTIDISAEAGQVTATGLGARVNVHNCEALDRIVVDGIGQDVVNVNGSAEADSMYIGAVQVLGLYYARVTGTGFSASLDVRGESSLAVNGLDGADSITAGLGLSSIVPVTINGGRGDDLIVGGGANVLLGGPGDDTFVWNPGGGNDVIEGQGGRDVLAFYGANIGETLALSANGSRFRLSRNIANVVLDVNGVEQVDLEAVGGEDHITIHDLAGSSVKRVNVNLESSTRGSADGLADTVAVNATTGADRLAILADQGAVTVNGLAAQVRISFADPLLDRLVIDGLGGNDTVRLGDGLDALLAVTVNP